MTPMSNLKTRLGKIEGRDSIKAYYDMMYQPVTSINFDFTRSQEIGSEVYLQWTMTMSSEKLKGGKPIVVDGTSFLIFNEWGQVTYHRDYFDLGGMLYEHIPVLGWMVRKIKGRLNHED